MNTIDYNKILNRKSIFDNIKIILTDIISSDDISLKRGIYLHGNPGIGKTTFILNLIQELNYDIIYYDGSDLRNKLSMENIADNNISKYNVSKLLNGEQKRIIIVMDDIESMNTGDKGGINALSKLIRPKKTKKQKKELKTTNPIICICDNHVDKKIKEIMKVCHVIELPTPTLDNMLNILKCNNIDINDINIDSLKEMNGDLRKLSLSIRHKCKFDYASNSENNDVKITVNNLFQNKYSLNFHDNLINETDRTIVGLIYHENLAFILNKLPLIKSSDVYIKMLNKICYADYLDRITFQKQIWQFNEISSLLKTMTSNIILHDIVNSPSNYIKQNDIHFTKVLTKYSTEYNNNSFFQEIAFKLNLESEEILLYFKSIRSKISEYTDYFINYNITDVDISRIYKYIDVREQYTPLLSE
tara:strand:+ start:3116 stop:4366 length:1251 start_codon:yes stop_codon:yes gene_type:complete